MTAPRKLKDAPLERYLADALPARARARMEALLAASAKDRQRLEELRADSAAFLSKHPLTLAVPHPRKRRPRRAHRSGR